MNRKWIIVGLALLAIAPIPVLAQDPPDPPRTPRPSRAPRATNRAWAYTMTNRGRIGVVVATDADAEKDRVGARIEAVTPGGPADDAGLKAGDIITKFNGTVLGGVRDEDEEVSGPGNKLVELAHALDPGDTARVEYRRGTENKTATIIAEDLGAWRGEMPGVSVMPRFEFPRMELPGFGGENNFSFVFGSPWGGLEMVTLNAELGEYFGAQEGVLVVKTSGDSSLPLKGGDVILAIDGRKPTSPSHAMRILGSYDEGEAVKIDVMRRQRRTTVTWTVPDRQTRVRSTPRSRPRGQSGEQSFFKFEPGASLLPLKVSRGIVLPMAKVASLRVI